MHYRSYDLYKAYKLKMKYLKRKLSGRFDHTLGKLDTFAEETMAWQQGKINMLETEKQELIDMIMTSDVALHYQLLQVAKNAVK